MDASTTPCKIIMVGDAMAGKSAALRRWMHGDFKKGFYLSAAMPEFESRVVEVDHSDVLLQLWDMSFSERQIHTSFSGFVSNASGVMLMYDITDPRAVEQLTYWFANIKPYTDEKTAFLVVACKADKEPASGLVHKVANLCAAWGIENMATSAKTGMNISACFLKMASLIHGRLSSFRNGAHHSMAYVAAGEDSREFVPQYKKVVVLGADGVGKSSMLQRFAHGKAAKIPDKYWTTPGPEFSTRMVAPNGKPLRVQMWDAAGSDLIDIPQLRGPFLRGAHGVVLMYDVTSRQSFTSLDAVLDVLHDWVVEGTVSVLVGNKLDLVPSAGRQVSFEEGQAVGELLGVPFAECTMVEGIDGLLDALFKDGNMLSLKWARGDSIEAFLQRGGKVEMTEGELVQQRNHIEALELQNSQLVRSIREMEGENLKLKSQVCTMESRFQGSVRVMPAGTGTGSVRMKPGVIQPSSPMLTQLQPSSPNQPLLVPVSRFRTNASAPGEQRQRMSSPCTVGEQRQRMSSPCTAGNLRQVVSPAAPSIGLQRPQRRTVLHVPSTKAAEQRLEWRQ